MWKLERTRGFERDVQKCIRRGWDMKALGDILRLLECYGTVPSEYRPHKLSGRFNGLWECHVKDDWVVVWRRDAGRLVLILTGTGTHDDLFGRVRR
jgi:mRNA interferase YafQ